MLFAHSSIAQRAKKAAQATQCCPAKTSGNPRPEIQQSHKASSRDGRIKPLDPLLVPMMDPENRGPTGNKGPVIMGP